MAVIAVNLWSSLRRFTDGDLVVEIEAATVGAVLDALVARHPGLGPVIEAGVSVTIDGDFATGRQTPVPEGAEVYLLQRIKGG